jgi:hypothetical protein
VSVPIQRRRPGNCGSTPRSRCSTYSGEQFPRADHLPRYVRPRGRGTGLRTTVHPTPVRGQSRWSQTTATGDHALQVRRLATRSTPRIVLLYSGFSPRPSLPKKHPLSARNRTRTSH